MSCTARGRTLGDLFESVRHLHPRHVKVLVGFQRANALADVGLHVSGDLLSLRRLSAGTRAVHVLPLGHFQDARAGCRPERSRRRRLQNDMRLAGARRRVACSHDAACLGWLGGR